MSNVLLFLAFVIGVCTLTGVVIGILESRWRK